MKTSEQNKYDYKWYRCDQELADYNEKVVSGRAPATDPSNSPPKKVTKK